jgi:nucleoid-associated protein YgaU
MKSTTLRRSNITREKVAMMEALSRYNREHQDEDFYRNQSKTRELDVLWQSFGVKSHKTEKAPQVYFVTGLVCGVIITLAIMTLVSILVNITTPKDDIIVPKKSAVVETSNVSFIPADTAAVKPVVSTPATEHYVVKAGDTLESIVIRFYGSFDMSKVIAIQDANKMANPNALSIGQKLIIPMK